MTVGEAVSWVEGRLATAGVDVPRLDAQMLVAHALGVERPWVLAHSADEFVGDGLDGLCERRVAREPLAYILGWREFYGRRFVVTPDVLIPRQETEHLVEVAGGQPNVGTLLDLGTGSGCIAVTVKLTRPEIAVTASDVSAAALEVARLNATNLGAEVEFVESDLFAGLQGRAFDVIVSNPPYIGAGENLMPEVQDFEPHLALFAGEDAFAFYRRLAEESQDHLTPGGCLVVEIGDGMLHGVSVLFEEHGWHVDQVSGDLTGKPRVLVLKPLDVQS
ncbi:MAG: peptide chain release factor N(5)-glutamine methyltransferase [Fimbriimonadaceae bacterium]